MFKKSDLWSESNSPVIVRKILEFAYTGQYSGGKPQIKSRFLASCGSNEELSVNIYSKEDFFIPADSEGSHHPSFLHLEVYTTAQRLSFDSLVRYSEQALLASLVVLFSKAEFAAFIKRLYSKESLSLQEMLLEVIIGNLNRFVDSNYPLISRDMLEDTPAFRDHLLSSLLLKQQHSMIKSADDRPLITSAMESSHEDGDTLASDRKISHSHLLNQRDLLGAINKSVCTQSGWILSWSAK